ncbi:MAG TPA: helix-turn-helix transcriptional regulator [Gemmatimonadales bacterium]|nr:helix-turn-helix transcriptional regulator [Gemmatimonadales bacterium]
MIAERVAGPTDIESEWSRPLGGPAVLRIVLGDRLRNLREARGVTREQAGKAVQAGHSRIGRLELGRVAAEYREVAALLTLYGVTDEKEREAVLGLARDAGLPGWWHRYGDVLPGWFDVYVGLEEAASEIRTYEVQFVPGLLQTEEYARAVALLMHVREPEEKIARRVDLRMARQRLLTRPDGPRLRFLLDEAALRRPLGGRRVLRAQLEHLVEMCELPGVTIQVVPFDADRPTAAGCPFTLLRFAEPALPEVVYLEQLTSALYLDKPDDVRGYTQIMDDLCAAAGPAADTPGVLHEIIAEI